MKKNIILILTLLLFTSVKAQEKNFRQEMIDSGEKQEKISEQFKTQSTDYLSFIRTKAWNVTKRSSPLFKNTKEIDMPIIGGRVRSSLVDTDNDIALVAPSGGGIWRFDAEAGSYFNPLDDFGSFMPITYITQDPKNPNTILFATGDEKHGTAGNGVFKSTDGGQTFAPLESTNPINNGYFQFIRFIKISPEASNIIYMAAYNRVYKSVDSGESWNLVFNSTRAIRSLEFGEGNSILIAADLEGIYKSPSGDLNTFTALTNNVPYDANANSLVIQGLALATNHADRSIAYAIFVQNNDEADIYKTTNNGTTWTKVTRPGFYIAQAWFCLTIGIHPTNPDIVIAGSVGWGYTTDGGSTWSSGADLEVDYHDVHFHPSNPDVAYVGYDQGIGRVDFDNYKDYLVWNGAGYITVSQPEQLELGKKPGFNTSQIYYGDYFPEAYGDAQIFGQQDGGCFAQVNGVEKRIKVGDGGSVFVNKQDPNKAIASTQYMNLSKTEDALVPNYGSYTQISNIPGKSGRFITQFSGNNADGNQLYLPLDTGIARSLDGGNSFTTIASDDLIRSITTVENALDPVVYSIGLDENDNYKPKGFRITNSATNAVAKSIQYSDSNLGTGTPDHINIDPNNNNAVYVTFAGGDAYRFSGFENSNIIMESVRGDISDVHFNTVIGIKKEPDLLFAGTNIGLFYSEDQGKNWILNEDIPFTQITDLKFRESDNRLFIFTYGRGTWATTIETETLSIPESSKNKTVIVYPNPTNDSFTVKTDKINNLSLLLFDVKGHLVLKSNRINNVDVSKLSSGLYMLHLKDNNQNLIATSKIVIE
ncbi:conserved hypothetical protein [Formosa agariphila KMM 3901]|uniref:Secretion system C-terminal sorting domain-containing protein n=1 Tax=Formosa agariphila (strain DSM 15362 / KCTC 12365 / LMG 23005 / KMM 3901 / M-2Alg 35-1) TaxID=1347342 RepID=T2KLE0_FORAG|nr:T9SS type A sorting domain-containing protein [Formosa agariphila]CDF79251.1 conserved hypothetical protein [Formosa agariphila KMM 3901]